MINSTTYAVAFPSSGVKLKGDFSPQPGLTAVIGPNGVGKTFTSIELTRYLLYGKKALRGKADDYDTLDAEGSFVIRDATYVIKRNSKRETLADSEGNVLATGADAVTKKVTELMGYGLNVFDITNASVQKKADLLGAMLPSQRKKLIDDVVGISSIQGIEKSLREEAAMYRREVEALTRQLRAPEKPPVAKHKPVVTLEHALSTGRAARREWDRIESQITRIIRPETPHSSIKRVHQADIDDLEQHESDRFELEADRRAIQARIDKRPSEPVPYNHLELNMARDRLAVSSMMRNAVSCPKCGTSFVPGHEETHLPDGPDLTMTEIQTYERNLMLELDANLAASELKDEIGLADRSQELKALRGAHQTWENYDQQIQRYEQQNKHNDELQSELDELPEAPSQSKLDQLADELAEARIYEAAQERYNEDKVRFAALTTEIKEKQRLADEFKKGSDNLGEARAVLKANLAPIMSRIASELITDMTHGKLVSVEIDEDMEITVNGQRIETLSGGGETVANIAIRLAIGQALVSRTFPVFLGDEMDADADDTRREAVVAALRALVETGRLKQVILVTHRSVEDADHVIDLENTQ